MVSVASWTAKLTTIYEFTSEVIFYVSTDIYSPGTAVDLTTLGAIATIDFTTAKSGQTWATVAHNEDGIYGGPVFDYPPTLRHPKPHPKPHA